jgi:hypothetical protein
MIASALLTKLVAPARLAALYGIVFCALGAYGAVTVSPFAPTTTDPVTLTLSNQFFSAASVTSATIAETGNVFVIDQNVNVGCTAPLAPVVTSSFPVGALPPGFYTIEAHVHLTGIPSPPCIASSEFTQTATFTVAPPPIPTIGWRELLLLALAVTVIAVLQIR